MKNSSQDSSFNFPTSDNSALVKIHKVIARRGYCSNRKAEELIKQNKVKVNSEIAHIGQLIEEDSQIEIEGIKIDNVFKEEKNQTFIMNKRIGDECSRNTFKNIHPSVFSKFDSSSKYFSSLKCIGRLDVRTSGLLLITTNSKLIQKIIHPSTNISKTYLVGTNKKLEKAQIKTLLQGLFIDGSISKPRRVEELKFLDINSSIKKQMNASSKFNKYCWYSIEVEEGKKHIIRKFFEHFNSKVEILHRTKIGNLNLSNFEIKQGEFKEINEDVLLKLIINEENKTKKN